MVLKQELKHFMVSIVPVIMSNLFGRRPVSSRSIIFHAMSLAVPHPTASTKAPTTFRSTSGSRPTAKA
ncbi:hypothetical protein [Rhodopirellula europaea]|jgi:hypothetical protein|uniref:hypothetical protein n=1 Tax=Rhodopirellula europaea TaxID=1263866 RepID=UPI001F477FA1|nr:hypothetical protein [Rhodopirellula europaea]